MGFSAGLPSCLANVLKAVVVRGVASLVILVAHVATVLEAFARLVHAT